MPPPRSRRRGCAYPRVGAPRLDYRCRGAARRGGGTAAASTHHHCRAGVRSSVLERTGASTVVEEQRGRGRHSHRRAAATAAGAAFSWCAAARWSLLRSTCLAHLAHLTHLARAARAARASAARAARAARTSARNNGARNGIAIAVGAHSLVPAHRGSNTAAESGVAQGAAMSPLRSNRRVLRHRGSFASAEEQCSAGAALPPPRSSHRLGGAQLRAGASRREYNYTAAEVQRSGRKAAMSPPRSKCRGGTTAATQQLSPWRRTASCLRATARVLLPKKAQSGGGMAPPRSSHRRGGAELRASEPRLKCRCRGGAGGADTLTMHTYTCTYFARTI